MIKYGLILLLTIILSNAGYASATAGEKDQSCQSCHEKETPQIARIWKASAHAEKGVGCEECHGKDYNANHGEAGKKTVADASVCARCHSEIAKQHYSGKHGIGFRAGSACTRKLEQTPEIRQGCNNCHEKGTSLPAQNAECARFLAQTPQMQRQGCTSCHKIEFRCDSCHTQHDTDLRIVRDPAVCGTCHMGPDHPQYEMWELSRHGVMYAQKGREYAPDCVTCHMPKGNHNVSEGISMGLFGQPYPEDKRNAEREKMLTVCSGCHTRSFAADNLKDGDEIQHQAKALLEEASSIIKELDKEGLLIPSPAARPPHPLSGQKLEIGPQMLYEDLSDIEADYFRMKKFYYIITYKGVFHQNPDYAHWYGNAPLKLSLSEIRSKAIQLRENRRLKLRMDNLSSTGIETPRADTGGPDQALQTELRRLRELYLKGDISKDDYDKRRRETLDKHGL
jgi:hypothetical protein